MNYCKTMEHKKKPCCAVFLSTYNGEKYVAQQIDSILNQSDVEVRLIIRDDGSTDSTKDIINSYRDDPRVSVKIGENVGYGRSFLELLYSTEAQYSCYAFSDQDDVWDSDKLIEGYKTLNHDTEPILYYCGQRIIDENGNNLCVDKSFERFTKCTFFSASKTNLIRGCTMIWNNSLHKEILKYKPDMSKIREHDIWISWMALLLGKLVYDDTPHMDYRQLESSVSPGADRTLGLSLLHKFKVMIYVWKKWKGLKLDYANELEKLFPNYELATAHYRESFIRKMELIFSQKYNKGVPLKWRLMSDIMIITNRL